MSESISTEQERKPKCVIFIDCPQCHDEEGGVQRYYAELTEAERRNLGAKYQAEKRVNPEAKTPNSEYHHECPKCHGARRIRLSTYHKILGNKETAQAVEDFERNAVRKVVRPDLAFWQVTRSFNE